MKKYDENSAIRSLTKIAKIGVANKTINVRKDTLIGIRRWAKIDYLIKVHHYHLVYDGTVKVSPNLDDSKQSVRDLKKQRKEHKLKDKRNG